MNGVKSAQFGCATHSCSTSSHSGLVSPLHWNRVLVKRVVFDEGRKVNLAGGIYGLLGCPGWQFRGCIERLGDGGAN